MRKLVWQYKRLQHKMSARDADTWSTIITQEEALDRQTTLPEEGEEEDDGLDDKEAAGDGPREAERGGSHVDKREREVGNETAGGNVDSGGGGELVTLTDIDGVAEVDRNSIDELMKLYYSCLQGTDGGELETKDVAAAGLGGGDQSSAAAETAAQDVVTMHEHDDMLEGLLSVADVVDMSDFPKSPIWHWGSSDLY